MPDRSWTRDRGGCLEFRDPATDHAARWREARAVNGVGDLEARHQDDVGAQVNVSL